MVETPMVEAVARAIGHALGAKAAAMTDTALLARAAIQTMRDTEFRVTDSDGAIHEVRGEPMSVWRFLFDAALASPEEGREL